MKSRVSPCPHLGDQFASDEALGYKKLKNVGFKQLSEHILLEESNRDKGAIGTKDSGSNQGMDVRIPVQKISCCGDREDAGRNEFLGKRNFQVLADCHPCAAA